MKNKLGELLELFSIEKAQGKSLISALGRKWRGQRQ